MLNVKKLVKLTESQEPGFSYRRTWQEQLGIYEEVNPRTKQKRRRFDVSKGSVNPRDVSLQEVDMAFGEAIGWRGDHGRWSAADFKLRHMQEAAVLPSTFAHISGFDQTIAGLLDALVLEAYDSPQYIGKELIGEQQWMVNGGKKITVANDGTLLGETQIGMDLPEVGLKEYWITLPTNKRYGNQIKINKFDFVYDRTGIVQGKATMSGQIIAFEIENIIAAGVMGLVANQFNAKDTAGNTFLSSAGTNPMNYINYANNKLVDWNNLNTSYVTLQFNNDPNTGIPIAVPTPLLLCSPHKYLHTRSILFPTMVQEYSATPGAASTRATYSNPIPDMGLNQVRQFTPIWYNKLIASATATGAGGTVGGGWTATNAQDAYLLGRPDRAYKWMSVQPFSTWAAPITADDMAQGVSLRHMTEEVGIFAVTEPRNVFLSTSLTPTS